VLVCPCVIWSSDYLFICSERGGLFGTSDYRATPCMFPEAAWLAEHVRLHPCALKTTSCSLYIYEMFVIILKF
jgi:hypothetical protein